MITSSKPRIRIWLMGMFAAITVALAAAPAAAQNNAKQRAKTLYQQGKTQFDLGNFDDAVKLFKQAYATSPYPAFLFNIAQAYRQMGDCKQALFFYKRFLTVAGDDAANKQLVEGHIKELSETCKASEEIKD
jgi:tetratricopeptide (TPR) repeat protein